MINLTIGFCSLVSFRFTLDDKRTKSSVVQYFHEKYNIVLKHTHLPALQAGSDSKPIFLPVEVCLYSTLSFYIYNNCKQQLVVFV